MKAKHKQCGFCPTIGPLWKSNPATCPTCARKQDAIKRSQESASKPTYNHTTLKQSDGDVAKPFKVGNKIAKVSKNMQAALAKYRRLRDKYFVDNPVCEFPDCNSRNITLHHKRGRIGAFLTDKRYFCSLCQMHHVYVETHPAEAKKIGLSDSRLENGVLLSKAI